MKKIILLCFQLSVLVSLSAQVEEIDCDLIHTPAEESLYILPYPVGESYVVIQSNCSPIGGHYLTFAYDFDMQLGDTVVASRAGVVVFVNDQYADSDWTSGHENNVFVQHSDGTRVRYTHLKQNSVLVYIGQNIVQGQVLGLSGSSGNTGGVPHLHFAAFQDGTSYDRQNTIPINYSNSIDPLNSQNLLIQGQSYTALGDGLLNDIVELEKEIVLYPNPIQSNVNLKLRHTGIAIEKIKIYNNAGKILRIVEVDNANSISQISMDDLTKGIYFLVIYSSGGSIVKKMIIN